MRADAQRDISERNARDIVQRIGGSFDAHEAIKRNVNRVGKLSVYQTQRAARSEKTARSQKARPDLSAAD
jgi:hypothetical protein